MMRKLALGVAFVLGAGCIFFACNRVAERGRFAVPYSTFGAGADGAHALFLLARDLGFVAQPFSHELTHLPAQATLVAIGGCDQPLAREVSRPEREELGRWLEAGGLLIVAGVEGYVPAAAGLHLESPATCDEDASATLPAANQTDADLPMPFELEARPEGAPLAYVTSLAIRRTAGVSATEDTEATVLIDSDYGPVAMTAPIGRGRVVLFGAGSLFTNRVLADGGGVIFARLLNAFAPKGPVLFDEYHLGMGERRSLVRYLRDLGLAPALLQSCVVVLLFLLASGQRLGPALEEAPPRQRVTQRYLQALGELYARTRDGEGALKALSRHGLSRIAKHYRLNHVPLEQLADALRGQGLAAVALYVDRVAKQAEQPLANAETMLTRAREVERDVRAALVVGDAA